MPFKWTYLHMYNCVKDHQMGVHIQMSNHSFRGTVHLMHVIFAIVKHGARYIVNILNVLDFFMSITLKHCFQYILLKAAITCQLNGSDNSDAIFVFNL